MKGAKNSYSIDDKFCFVFFSFKSSCHLPKFRKVNAQKEKAPIIMPYVGN